MHTLIEHSKRTSESRRQAAIPATPLAVFILVICLLGTPCAAQFYTFGVSRSLLSVDAKARVEELGLGAKVKLSTPLRTKRFRGYITSIGDNSFEMTDVKQWRTYTFAYADIQEVTGRSLPDPTAPIGNRVLRSVLKAASKLRMGP
jgi:hypothetical protein